MKKRPIVIIILAFLSLFSLILIFPFSRSLLIMSVYSAAERRDSVLKNEGISLNLPGGLSTPEKDWYPLVITFNADHFGAYADRPVDLTILYTFGAFDPALGCSSFYNPASNYHGAFYGAYAIKSSDGTVYGYRDDGTLDVEAMEKVFQYDMNILVLQSLGCDDPFFDYTLLGTAKKTIDGYVFDVIDGEVVTQSPLHTVSTFHPAYYQYGRPKRLFTQKDFKKLSVYGRIYASELSEKGITLCFYMIAPDRNTLETCEKDMIEKAKICLD